MAFLPEDMGAPGNLCQTKNVLCRGTQQEKVDNLSMGWYNHPI
jgi:hypothetical protein